jgi:hypothetical protein
MAHSLLMTIANESDRGLVLLCAAAVDDALHLLLRRLVFPLDPGDRGRLRVVEQLFGSAGDFGPLQSFGVRIRFAYAVGAISRAKFNALRVLQDVRNDFAHLTDVSLSEPENTDRIRDFAVAPALTFDVNATCRRLCSKRAAAVTATTPRDTLTPIELAESAILRNQFANPLDPDALHELLKRGMDFPNPEERAEIEAMRTARRADLLTLPSRALFIEGFIAIYVQLRHQIANIEEELAPGKSICGVPETAALWYQRFPHFVASVKLLHALAQGGPVEGIDGGGEGDEA